MFSGSAFSEHAFSEHDYTPAVEDTAFADFLADVTAERCWLLEVDAFPLSPLGGGISGAFDAAFSELGFSEGGAAVAAGVVTLYFSDRGYTDGFTYYEPRLTGDLQIERDIIGNSRMGGLAVMGADVQLANPDGGLDSLVEDYGLDGRPARILVGPPDGALSEFGVVFTGIVRTVPRTMLDARLTLSDGLSKLDKPLQGTLYTGAGGLEGGADLKGKRKPRGWGEVFNITPPLVDGVNLIYQVNDGPIKDVPAVYDRGVVLTKVAGAPAPGQYQVDTTNGTFTLGAPADFVTCDAELDASLSGYVSSAAEVVLRMLIQAGLNSQEIEPGSFVQLGSDAPWAVGIWVWENARTAADAVNEVLASVGAFGGFNRMGAFAVGQVQAPGGTPVATFTEDEIGEGLAREALPEQLEPVVWRVRVGYQPNYTVQNDLAGSVPASRKQFAAEAIRFTQPAEDTGLQSRRLLARELDVPGLFAEGADADYEKLRQFGLWSVGYAPHRFPLPLRALICELGDCAEFEHSRLKRGAITSGRVLGYHITPAGVDLRALL